jgi:site-specific recombinase XerD
MQERAGASRLHSANGYGQASTPTCSFASRARASAQLTRQAVNYIARVAGEEAKLGRVWPHMLRHSCGYYLADRGTDPRTMQDYLGHRDPKYTAHYSRVAGSRFEGLWR